MATKRIDEEQDERHPGAVCELCGDPVTAADDKLTVSEPERMCGACFTRAMAERAGQRQSPRAEDLTEDIGMRASFRKRAKIRAVEPAPCQPSFIRDPSTGDVTLILRFEDGSRAFLDFTRDNAAKLARCAGWFAVLLVALTLAVGSAHAEEYKRPTRTQTSREAERRAEVCQRHPATLGCDVKVWCEQTKPARALRCYAPPAQTVASLEVAS